jgi:hypothetical protein
MAVLPWKQDSPSPFNRIFAALPWKREQAPEVYKEFLGEPFHYLSPTSAIRMWLTVRGEIFANGRLLDRFSSFKQFQLFAQSELITARQPPHGSWDGLEIWSLETGRMQFEIPIEKGEIIAAFDFSPNGRYLSLMSVICDEDKKRVIKRVIKIWRLPRDI